MWSPLLPSIPRSELPTPEPRTARECGNYNASSISNRQEKPFVGWAGPVGPAAAAVAKSLSDTESMGMGHGVLPRSRYPYPVPRIRMCTCTISSRSSVTASTAFLWTIRPHERRTSTLKYLFVFSSAFICTFRLCPVLSALGASLYLSVLPHPVYHQLRCQTNKSPPPSHTQLHNGRFCSRCCQGHQVRA